MAQLDKRVFLIGMMGSGKSFWARKLAGHYNVPWFDTDQMIERQAGMPIREIFSLKDGECIFREMERALLRETEWPEACIIACGGGLPCFHQNMEYMLQLGMVVWLDPGSRVIADRLWGEKSQRPLVAVCASFDDLQMKIGSLIAERNSWYQLAHAVIHLPDPDIGSFLAVLEPREIG
ncbi:MAG TPA: shikimate kinase [Phnomibacter sp.]|nr:shikimate kinase [Phnomibacter sp.]